MPEDTVAAMQRSMRAKASAGHYDQPEAIAAMQAKAREGDLDAQARLKMLKHEW